MDNTPTLKRKRLRSVTPSDSGGHPNGEEILGSPLAKRKKLAADRTGSSLKEGLTADDLSNVQDEAEGFESAPSSPKLLAAIPEVAEDTAQGEDEDEGDEEEEYEEEEEEDFLARDMEEEWG